MQKEYFVICATVASHLRKTNHRFHLLVRAYASWRQRRAFTASPPFFCVTRSSFRRPSVLIVDYNMVVVTHGSQGSNVSRLGRSVFVCMFKDNTSTPQIYLSVLAKVFSHQARLWPSTEFSSPLRLQPVGADGVVGICGVRGDVHFSQDHHKPWTQMSDASNDDGNSTNARYSATPHEPPRNLSTFLSTRPS